MNYKKNTFTDYFKTICITIFIVFVIVLTILFYLARNVYTHKPPEIVDDEFRIYMSGLMLERYKYLAEVYPENYKVNLRLGIIYEVLGKPQEAEDEFKLAIEKSYYSNYLPTYRLALFYIKQGEIRKAKELMDSVSERPDKKLINYKGSVYNKIGDYYFDRAEYVNAVEHYLRALYYFEKIDDNAIKSVNKSLMSAYIYAADDYVKSGKIADAIIYLKKSMEIKKTAIAEYKLGLLLIDDMPEVAAEHFANVFKKEPQMFDYDIYLNLLKKLVQKEQAAGNNINAELYKIQINKFLKFNYENLVSKKEVEVDIPKAKITKMDDGTNSIDLLMRLKNNNQRHMFLLYTDVIFKDGSKIFDTVSINSVTAETPIPAGTYSKPIEVKSIEKFNDSLTQSDRITVEIYAYKNPKYKRLIASYQLLKPKKAAEEAK